MRLVVIARRRMIFSISTIQIVDQKNRGDGANFQKVNFICEKFNLKCRDEAPRGWCPLTDAEYTLL